MSPVDRPGARAANVRDNGESARYINPDCQWQGTSRADCDERLQDVKVQRTKFTRYVSTVRVCMNHVAAYIRQAEKDGVLA